MMETVVAVRVSSTSDGTSDSSSTSDSTSSVHQCEDSVVSPPSDKSSVLRLRSLSPNSVSFSVKFAEVSVEEDYSSASVGG